MPNVKDDVQTEYGKVQLGSFTTELGITIPNVEIAFERVGPQTAPVIIVCHALTGNQHTVGTEAEPGWWSGLIGKEKYIDTIKWQVITMNVLGGCNGSTGPKSIGPNGQPYNASFPFVSVRDIVTTQYLALKELGIDQVHAIIGGSLGGMQVLEWGVLYPEFAKLLFPLATSPYLSDFGMAYNSIARYAITNDPNWQNGEYCENPEVGLSIARMIGMISYRSPELFNARFSRETREGFGNYHQEKSYQVDSYLTYQGEKFLKRFDANSYLYLLKVMDHHDLGRNRGDWKSAIAKIRSKIIAISFEGDIIYPSGLLKDVVKEHQQVLSSSNHYEVSTVFGHDGFLVEFEKWGHLVEEGLSR
ncbi:homoserine O-acetyltransferase MetX [Bacillus pinisoli]|uniref:homoserine O-acetyltransferase MetX n=1 Tax=Bacillus pinisoli TaxID=2901866 RepID=UPI001FF22909|nr:homoserine O-acetyltransferase [Bacillus pinisoli]